MSGLVLIASVVGAVDQPAAVLALRAGLNQPHNPTKTIFGGAFPPVYGAVSITATFREKEARIIA
jgi:hypothetical protein